jgi:hypothetical protein
MKRTLFFLLIGSAMSLSLASAQQAPLKGYTTVIPLHAPPANASTSALRALIAVPTPLPMWTYSITASADLGGGVYSGSIIGHSPYLRGKAVTTIPAQIIPLVITITDTNGTIVYDPTAPDACVSGHTVDDIITGSPVFTNNTSWTMNGVNVGTTQYEDANVRAEFWSLVSGSNYHLLLSETTLASQSLSFGTGGADGPGTNYPTSDFGLCDPIGVININDLDNAVQALITGPLAGTVNVGTFPIFLTKNVVSALSGTSIFTDCCVLGYHSAFTVGPNIQVYSPFAIDTAGAFGPGYTSAFSHEVGEAIHDPTTNNPTPVWGNIGQDVGNCTATPPGQNNFEVGDPLSPGFGTPTNEWIVPASNGLTYDLQELAFFNWFYGGTSLGTGGFFSNNGTFGGDAILCSAGGGSNGLNNP